MSRQPRSRTRNAAPPFFYSSNLLFLSSSIEFDLKVGPEIQVLWIWWKKWLILLRNIARIVTYFWFWNQAYYTSPVRACGRHINHMHTSGTEYILWPIIAEILSKNPKKTFFSPQMNVFLTVCQKCANTFVRIKAVPSVRVHFSSAKMYLTAAPA